MSENKHVFEIVPGKQLGTALEMYKGNKSGNVIRELPDIDMVTLLINRELLKLLLYRCMIKVVKY